jgi:purine-binding chemotaxis protein CheW
VREQFLLFRVGEEIYGLGLRGLRRVLLADGVAGLPNPPYQVCGALTYRGRRVPVIRLGELFGVPRGEGQVTARLLLTQGEGYALGLLVDEVLDLAEVDPMRIAPVPAMATLLDPGFFRGLFRRQDRIVLLVNEDGLGRFAEVVRFYAAGP